jgi:hypothetical protein
VTDVIRRDSYELAQSFRIISLTSFFLKTMERLVDSYIDPLRLFLFKRLRGVSIKKELALGVFLGIGGAFDNSSFGSMDPASGEHGVTLTLRRWIDAVPHCRSVRSGKAVSGCTRKSGMLTWRSTVPFVVEHGGGSWTVYFVGSIMYIIKRRATPMIWFCCKKAGS